MSQVCWKPVKFADVKDGGKLELSMVNRGIDARIATKIRQRRMGEKNILKKSEDALW